MTNNEDQGQCGEQHERMTIEDFLRTNANTILTWNRKGKNYFARYDDSKTNVQITSDLNDPCGYSFPMQALMAQIYEHLE